MKSNYTELVSMSLPRVAAVSDFDCDRGRGDANVAASQFISFVKTTTRPGGVVSYSGNMSIFRRFK